MTNGRCFRAPGPRVWTLSSKRCHQEAIIRIGLEALSFEAGRLSPLTPLSYVTNYLWITLWLASRLFFLEERAAATIYRGDPFGNSPRQWISIQRPPRFSADTRMTSSSLPIHPFPDNQWLFLSSSFWSPELGNVSSHLRASLISCVVEETAKVDPKYR